MNAISWKELIWIFQNKATVSLFYCPQLSIFKKCVYNFLNLGNVTPFSSKWKYISILILPTECKIVFMLESLIDHFSHLFAGRLILENDTYKIFKFWKYILNWEPGFFTYVRTLVSFVLALYLPESSLRKELVWRQFLWRIGPKKKEKE